MVDKDKGYPYRKKLKLLEKQYQEQVSKKKVEQIERLNRYRASPYGKAASKISRVFSYIKSPSRAVYTKTAPIREAPFPYPTTRSKTVVNRGAGYRKVGRPRGTLDPRYAQYGGVYGYRKFIAHQRRLERIKALRDMAVTPQQQVVLRQIEARNQAARMNPENRIIPDTDGGFNLNGIFKEIDDAANAVF